MSLKAVMVSVLTLNFLEKTNTYNYLRIFPFNRSRRASGHVACGVKSLRSSGDVTMQICAFTIVWTDASLFCLVD